MIEISLATAFLIGIAGGVHCIGMCGGITVALQSAVPADGKPWIYACAYHLGRIFSYAIAGLCAGLLGAIVSHSSLINGVSLLTVLSGVMLILLGGHIASWFSLLHYFERQGGRLWRHIQPLSKSLIPFKHPFHAFVYGTVWGWLPCGLVYSTLSWSMASGEPISGLLVMLFFGLGTLPIMFAVSMGATQFAQLARSNAMRTVIAILLLGYGLYLIFKGVTLIT